jgi:hypothetical protein
MNNQNQYDDSQWRIKIQFANRIFNNGDRASSVQHYQVAIDMGKRLFIDYKNIDPLPDALTPVLVVSYLNLADCWAVQNKKKEQILCLIEIYDFLKVIINDHFSSPALTKQAYEGVSKIFVDLCACFREIGAQQELGVAEKDYSELSVLYQSLLHSNQIETMH